MFDVTEVIGLGLVFTEDESGRMTISCERGVVYAADDAIGEHFVAVLKSKSPSQRQRLFKLRLPTLCVNEKEYSVRVGHDKLYKVLKVLKPRKHEARKQTR